MSITLHPGAEIDVAEAVNFYTVEGGRLVAERFLNEFDRVAQMLLHNPGFGTQTTKGRQVYPLRVFPYSVVYRAHDSGIRILVVRHQHRKPSYGNARR